MKYTYVWEKCGLRDSFSTSYIFRTFSTTRSCSLHFAADPTAAVGPRAHRDRLLQGPRWKHKPTSGEQRNTQSSSWKPVTTGSADIYIAVNSLWRWHALSWCFLSATPVAHRNSQAKGRIGPAAVTYSIAWQCRIPKPLCHLQGEAGSLTHGATVGTLLPILYIFNLCFNLYNVRHQFHQSWLIPEFFILSHPLMIPWTEVVSWRNFKLHAITLVDRMQKWPEKRCPRIER